MEINIYRANNNLYIDIAGRVFLDVCEDLKNAAIPLIDKGINQVYVDLSGVDFIDSAGLGVLVGMKMTSNKNKARLVLVSPSSGVSDILQVSKLHSIFDIITGSEAEMLEKSLAIEEYLIESLEKESESPRKAAARSANITEDASNERPKMPTGSGKPRVAPTPQPQAQKEQPSLGEGAGKSAKEQVDENCRKAVELMRQGDYEKAVEKYEDALKIDPEYLPAYNNLAIVYEKRPAWRSKAIETWEKVLELSQAAGDQKHIDRAQKHLSNLKTSF